MSGHEFDVGYWRIASWNRHNLDFGVAAREWGTRLSRTLPPLDVGDRVVLYVTKGRGRGCCGTATVTREVFAESERIWADGEYPLPRRPRNFLHKRLSKPMLSSISSRRGIRILPYGWNHPALPDEFSMVEGLIEKLVREQGKEA